MQWRREGAWFCSLALTWALLLGTSSGVARAADDSDIPGVPLPGSVATGQLGGPIYDHVYSIDIPAQRILLVSLIGDPGTDFDLYLFNSTATTVYSTQGQGAASNGPPRACRSFLEVAPPPRRVQRSAPPWSRRTTCRVSMSCSSARTGRAGCPGRSSRRRSCGPSPTSMVRSGCGLGCGTEPVTCQGLQAPRSSWTPFPPLSLRSTRQRVALPLGFNRSSA